MLKVILYIFLFLLIANIATGPALAKNIPRSQIDIQDFLDHNIFSLSKKREDAFDAPSAIYVLTSNDIRRSGATSIPEALRLVPGLQVARSSNNVWAISSRGFNDQFSNKLLVMIDGRVIYTPLFSGTLWDIQDYILEDIEKIEVIRGPGGTIWGANAMNGIINIITKNSTLTQGGYASVISGNSDQLITEARYGGKTKNKNHYRIYAKHVNRNSLERLDDKTSNKDDYGIYKAGFRYDIKSDTDSNIAIHSDVRQNRSRNFFGSLNDQNSRENTKRSKGANFLIELDKALSDKSRFFLNTYFDYNQDEIPLLSRTSKTADVNFQHFYNFSHNNEFIWGVGYRFISDAIKESRFPSLVGVTNNGYFLDFEQNKRKDEVYSALMQNKIGVIPNKLYFTIGSKFEYNDFTGSEIQPSAKLAFYPTSNQTIWGSVARAVRTPSKVGSDVRLAFFDEKNSPKGVVKGNGGYKSEKVISYELGYRINPTQKSMIDIALFYNDYKDLKTYEAEGYGGNFNWNAANLGYGNSRGFEITTKWQVIDNWRLEASYDFLKMNINTKPNSLDSPYVGLVFTEGQSPRNQFRLRSNYNITPKIEFDNMIYYVDSLPLSYDNGDISGVPSYVRLDTRISYLPTNNLELSLVGQNLTDKRHHEFEAGLFNRKTQIGRTFYFKLVWDF